MTLRGEWVKSKAVHDILVSVEHKKDKKIFLHIDLTYLYQGNKMSIHTLSHNQAYSFSRKRLEQIFTLSTQHMFNFYCHGAHQLNLITIEIYNHLKYVYTETIPSIPLRTTAKQLK